jgi:hypothetical protein
MTELCKAPKAKRAENFRRHGAGEKREGEITMSDQPKPEHRCDCCGHHEDDHAGCGECRCPITTDHDGGVCECGHVHGRGCLVCGCPGYEERDELDDYEREGLRRVTLFDGRVMWVDDDDPNDDETIRAALEEDQ